MPGSVYAKTTLWNVYKVLLSLSLVLFKALQDSELRTIVLALEDSQEFKQVQEFVARRETRLRIKLTLESKHLDGRGQKGRWPGKDFPEELTFDLSLKGH